MITGYQVVSSISIITISLTLAMGIYVVLKNRYLNSSRALFLVAVIAALTGLMDYLVTTAPDEIAARTFARLLVFLSIVLATAMLYLTAYLPYERERSYLISHKRMFAFISITIGTVLAICVDSVTKNEYGWGIALDWSVMLWYAIVYVIYLAGILSMVRLFRHEKDDVKLRTLPMIFAMVTPISLDIALTIAIMQGRDIPSDVSLAILISGTLFVYSIFKQKLFVVRPTKEENIGRRPLPMLNPGQCVLVEGMTNDYAYGMFVNELASSSAGMLITPIQPERIMERYGLKSTPMLWLTSAPGPDSIDPSNINVLMHAMVQFLKKGGDSIVLLDGLECLRSSNDPKDVMHLLYGLRDVAIVAGSKLIVTVNPEILGRKELILMERDMDPIKV